MFCRPVVHISKKGGFVISEVDTCSQIVNNDTTQQFMAVIIYVNLIQRHESYCPTITTGSALLYQMLCVRSVFQKNTSETRKIIEGWYKDWVSARNPVLMLF